ncbi:hypothetical protein B0H17DRAFT_1148745 [Mycena rosella]|uniref:Uncharacterized protein n=1 Tax=Mycena rosella TaxID=1033263 RepID=A0AAD7C9P3_MYCRO|nr:hypothetical protein B0H17DRAFT_1148745 [Mycena rosella]
MIRDRTDPSKLRLKIERPPSSASPLFTAAHSNPRSIDELLIPNLLDASLPSALAYLIDGTITGNVTPPLYWGGDPRVSRTDMLNCMVHATMIGRAFSLLSTSAPAPAGKTVDDVIAAATSLLPTELRLQIHAEYRVYQQQRRRIWQHGLTPIFIKALMSGSDPAPAARFAAAILFLTCWTSIKAARPPVKGNGTDYVWYFGTFTDQEWGLEDLESALQETKALPRENWDYKALEAKIKDGKDFQGIPEYIPLECIEMLDAARKHVAEGGTEWPQRDYTSDEVVTMALDALKHAQQTAGNGAKGNWNDYLGQAFSEWEEEMSGQWVPAKPKPRPAKKKGKKSA